MEPKKRLLFVDDEPHVLHGLRRQLHSMRRKWETTCVSSGAEALALLAQEPFDVVVTDMRMPGMDGAQLLQEVMRRYPQMARLALSAQTDKDMLLRTLGAVHQYLTKPCEAKTLQATLTRVFAVQDLLANPQLKQLVAQMKTLPSLPTLYHQIIAVCQSPDVSAEAVGQIIERDLGMTAKILQLVNSAFFGLRRMVLTPTEAVVFLGLETIKNLVLTAEIFTCFEQTPLGQFSLPALWDHSAEVAALVRLIAEAEKVEARQIGELCLAGLLHDVGKLIFAANFRAEYQRVLERARAEKQELAAAEQAAFGTSHAEVGAYLLGLWGLPDAIVEALAYHHAPTRCPTQEFSALTTLHVANAWAHELHPNQGPASSLDLDYLQTLGLTQRMQAWRAAYFPPPGSEG